MKKRVKISLMLLCICIVTTYVYATATNPTSPESITRESDERFSSDNWLAIQVDAEAGNVTELTISSLTQTQTWQGYYGNITGTIVLDDAGNWSMYTWVLAEPQGEIYASNSSSVNWSGIRCLNYSANASNEINLTTIENMFGLAADDVDGVDETFNVSGKLSDGATDHPIVYVGTNTIAAGTCPAADTYEVDSSSGTNFIEILLTDTASIIFTAVIENNIVGNDTEIYGFDNRTHDFQMLVGDDGHDGDDSVTPYYFFVELE